MDITVLYFATLRDHAGQREEQLTLPDGSTVSDLRSVLAKRHSGLEPSLASAIFAVNREYAFPEEVLQDGDEVALFPPVSGGTEPSQPTIFQVTKEPLDLNTLLESLLLPTSGAACVFTGVVRAYSSRGEERQTNHLVYEAYEPMAKEKLGQVVTEIRARWPSVEGIAIVQRIGRLEASTPTVMIVCTAAHRDTGVFEAARYGIDRLKQIVPIWKKEVGPDGEVWIEGDYFPEESDRQS
jgi:molybdopterin synthase catalytic subunit